MTPAFPERDKGQFALRGPPPMENDIEGRDVFTSLYGCCVVLCSSVLLCCLREVEQLAPLHTLHTDVRCCSYNRLFLSTFAEHAGGVCVSPPPESVSNDPAPIAEDLKELMLCYWKTSTT